MTGKDRIDAAIMFMGPRRHEARRLVDQRRGEDKARLDDLDARLVQCFARQIEPVDRRIFIEIAQDVGELQRAAEMMGQRETGILVHPEYLDRQAADGAGHAVAIKIERFEAGGADVLRHIHVHAVDHGKEILLA